jgi:hypothetical protein
MPSKMPLQASWFGAGSAGDALEARGLPASTRSLDAGTELAVGLDEGHGSVRVCRGHYHVSHLRDSVFRAATA